MSTIPLASSIREVPPSRIRELANLAFKMEGVLKLYFGESNQPTPQYIKDAAVQALVDGYTFYTHNAGGCYTCAWPLPANMTSCIKCL